MVQNSRKGKNSESPFHAVPNPQLLFPKNTSVAICLCALTLCTTYHTVHVCTYVCAFLNSFLSLPSFPSFFPTFSFLPPSLPLSLFLVKSLACFSLFSTLPFHVTKIYPLCSPIYGQLGCVQYSAVVNNAISVPYVQVYLEDKSLGMGWLHQRGCIVEILMMMCKVLSITVLPSHTLISKISHSYDDPMK